jgi:hypothetical protein
MATPLRLFKGARRLEWPDSFANESSRGPTIQDVYARAERGLFFGYYEGFRNKQGYTTTATVPSDVQRTGSYQALLVLLALATFTVAVLMLSCLAIRH